MEYDDLRICVLTWLKHNRGKTPPRQMTLSLLDADGDPEMLRLLVGSLWKEGFIGGINPEVKGGGDVLNPEIKQAGIEALLGPQQASSSTIYVGGISGGYNQFGNGNEQHINVHLKIIVETIQNAEIPEAEKKSALGKLHAFVSDPAVSNVIQGASGIAQMLGG